MPDWLLKVQRIRHTSQDKASMLFSALWSFKAEHAVGSSNRDSTSRSTGLCTSRVSVYWIDRATKLSLLGLVPGLQIGRLIGVQPRLFVGHSADSGTCRILLSQDLNTQSGSEQRFKRNRLYKVRKFVVQQCSRACQTEIESEGSLDQVDGSEGLIHKAGRRNEK